MNKREQKKITGLVKQILHLHDLSEPIYKITKKKLSLTLPKEESFEILMELEDIFEPNIHSCIGSTTIKGKYANIKIVRAISGKLTPKKSFKKISK